MTSRDALLVPPAALAAELAREPATVLLDARWRLGGPPGIDSYREGHLPGAVFVDLAVTCPDRPARPDGTRCLTRPVSRPRCARLG